MDGYESYGEGLGMLKDAEGQRALDRHNTMLMCPLCSIGECVVALKSMIGSTAQQFLTFLSHRGEETGNIRGSMKVRVPTERLGTRERLYGGGSTGRGVGWAACVLGRPVGIPQMIWKLCLHIWE